jgi:hypothetical protein
MLARRICAPSSIEVTGAKRWLSSRRGIAGIVAARTTSTRSSINVASGHGSHPVRIASNRVQDGPPARS